LLPKLNEQVEGIEDKVAIAAVGLTSSLPKEEKTMNRIGKTHQSQTQVSLVTTSGESSISTLSNQLPKRRLNLLQMLRASLDHIEIHDQKLARFISKVIPAQCPFERDVKLFGRQVLHIPPLCKLNPFYEQVVGLRFRALAFLVDECGEDIQAYCS
jgi:hypothetical protein